MNTDSVVARPKAGWLLAPIKKLRAILRNKTIFSVVVFKDVTI
jgi:hypothetical protein